MMTNWKWAETNKLLFSRSMLHVEKIKITTTTKSMKEHVKLMKSVMQHQIAVNAKSDASSQEESSTDKLNFFVVNMHFLFACSSRVIIILVTHQLLQCSLGVQNEFVELMMPSSSSSIQNQIACHCIALLLKRWSSRCCHSKDRRKEEDKRHKHDNDDDDSTDKNDDHDDNSSTDDDDECSKSVSKTSLRWHMEKIALAWREMFNAWSSITTSCHTNLLCCVWSSWLALSSPWTTRKEKTTLKKKIMKPCQKHC